MNKKWSYTPFSDLFSWCQKSNIGSRKGNSNGQYPLYIASATEIKRYDEYLEEGESLIFGTGGNPCIHYVTGKFAYTDHTEVAKKRNSSIETKFYYYYFQVDRFALLSSTFVGGGIKNSSKKKIGSLLIPVIEIEEQKRIVARIEELFSQLESGVETLKQTKAQLAVYRQAVLSCAFPELTDTNKKLLMEIADITGGITKGRHLEGQDVIELPYLRVANVQDGYLDLSEMKTIQLKRSEREKYLLQYDDVLYTEGGDRDKLGRGTVWRNEIPDCVHQNHIFKARINQELAIPQYVAYWSLSRNARNYFFTKGKQTVNLASINKTVLSNLPLPIPTLEEQRKTISEIEDRLSVCDQIEQTVDAALQQAEALRQSILKKAFEGGL